jgi:orotidine-5'-phosphate decarboxylase
MTHTRDYLIADLDFSSRRDMLETASLIREDVAMVRIGLPSFITFGPPLLHNLRDLGVDIFLDLRLHDHVSQIGSAIKQASLLGPKLLSVHATGGPAMIQLAQAAVMPRTRLVTFIDLPNAIVSDSPQSIAHSVSTYAQMSLDAQAAGFICQGRYLTELQTLSGLKIADGLRLDTPLAAYEDESITFSEALGHGAELLILSLKDNNPLQSINAVRHQVAGA